MSDSYYELLDAADELGEKFLATDMVRSTWSAAIQHAAPVSALLVRGLERCEQRDDTRLSRVLVDLLGGVPVEGDLWVRSGIERSGKQIDIRKWTFMNTDLAVHVHRIPQGEWIGIRAETNYGPDGIGTTIGTLFDENGAIGAIQQSVLVRPMPSRTNKVIAAEVCDRGDAHQRQPLPDLVDEDVQHC